MTTLAIHHPTSALGRTVTTPAHNLLLVANETLAGTAVLDAVERLIAEDARVLVVCPVLVARSRYWTSDISAGIAHAGERLLATLEALRARGIDAEGLVGDGHPLLAMEDALHGFPADHILITTHPPTRSPWLERQVVKRARSRFRLPLSHVVIDLEA
jgi:GABA permease